MLGYWSLRPGQPSGVLKPWQMSVSEKCLQQKCEEWNLWCYCNCRGSHESQSFLTSSLFTQPSSHPWPNELLPEIRIIIRFFILHHASALPWECALGAGSGTAHASAVTSTSCDTWWQTVAHIHIWERKEVKCVLAMQETLYILGAFRHTSVVLFIMKILCGGQCQPCLTG